MIVMSYDYYNWHCHYNCRDGLSSNYTERFLSQEELIFKRLWDTKHTGVDRPQTVVVRQSLNKCLVVVAVVTLWRQTDIHTRWFYSTEEHNHRSEKQKQNPSTGAKRSQTEKEIDSLPCFLTHWFNLILGLGLACLGPQQCFLCMLRWTMNSLITFRELPLVRASAVDCSTDQCKLFKKLTEPSFTWRKSKWP